MNGKKIVELSFKEFLIVLLRKWLILFICAALVGGIVSVKAYLDSKESVDELHRRYQVNQTTYNQEIFATQEAIRYYTSKRDAQEAFNAQSVLMQIDPFNVRTARLTFLVNVTEKKDNVDSTNRTIAEVYRALAKSSEIMELIPEDIRKKYSETNLKGLVQIEEPAVASSATNLVTISAFGNEDINPSQVLDSLFRHLETQKDSVALSTASHQLTSLGIQESFESSDTLAQEQKDKRDLVAEDSKQIKELEDELGKMQGRKPKAPSIIRSSLRMGLIATLVALIILSFVLIIIYVSQIPIQTSEQIQNQLGIRYLGGGLFKKGILFGAWGDKLSGIDKLASQQEIKKLLFANIREASFGKYNKIFVTGTVPESILGNVARELLQAYQAYPQEKIQFFAGKDVLNNAAAVDNLNQSEAVILVERVNVSKLKQVYQNIERIRQAGKPIIGYTLM